VSLNSECGDVPSSPPGDEALDQTAARRTLTLGSCHYTRRDLEEIRDAGQMIHIRVLGLASIAADVSPQLATAGPV
jgi:hypothetical protein